MIVVRTHRDFGELYSFSLVASYIAHVYYAFGEAENFQRKCILIVNFGLLTMKMIAYYVNCLERARTIYEKRTISLSI